MPLQQRIRFYIPLESTCCYLLRTTMSSLTGNHTMDLFYLLKESFKNLLFDLLAREGALRICLIYQVVRSHKDQDSEEYARTYYEALNQTLLTQKYRGSPPNTFYGLEAYVTH